MKGTAVFKKRIKECTSWREEVYFNMSFQKTSLNLFQLYHIASIHCRKGKKNILFPYGGQILEFLYHNCGKIFLIHEKRQKGKFEFLRSSDTSANGPAGK